MKIYDIYITIEGDLKEVYSLKIVLREMLKRSQTHETLMMVSKLWKATKIFTTYRVFQRNSPNQKFHFSKNIKNFKTLFYNDQFENEKDQN